jgi:hypothetical protein
VGSTHADRNRLSENESCISGHFPSRLWSGAATRSLELENISMSTKSATSSKSPPSARAATVVPITTAPASTSKLMQQHGCAPALFAGTDNSLYQRHLLFLFDHVLDLATATGRAQVEIFRHSVRDIVSQRGMYTETTCERENWNWVYRPAGAGTRCGLGKPRAAKENERNGYGSTHNHQTRADKTCGMESA